LEPQDRSDADIVASPPGLGLPPDPSGKIFSSSAPRDRNCQAVSAKTLVNDRPSVRADAATAGGLVIGAIVACSAAGFGLGTLVDLAVPFGLAGVFAGLIVGMALVYSRYRRI
jgi:hypothetical protein